MRTDEGYGDSVNCPARNEGSGVVCGNDSLERKNGELASEQWIRFIGKSHDGGKVRGEEVEHASSPPTPSRRAFQDGNSVP